MDLITIIVYVQQHRVSNVWYLFQPSISKWIMGPRCTVGGHTITQIAHIIAQMAKCSAPHTHTIDDSFFTGSMTKFNTLSLTSMKTFLNLWAYFRGQILGWVKTSRFTSSIISPLALLPGNNSSIHRVCISNGTLFLAKYFIVTLASQTNVDILVIT